MKKIFTSLYLAPISYYKELLSADEVLIEQYNHYEKKTYQNRCEILSANGKIALSIPVEKGVKGKNPFRDVRVSNQEDWKKQHLSAIESAYRNSPFYEYYIDDFLPIYKKETEFLIDFNMELHQVVMDAIDEMRDTRLTDAYYQNDDAEDCRALFHPNKKQVVEYRPYYQVFCDKLNFEQDLSILDLLFNLGPEVELYLKNS